MYYHCGYHQLKANVIKLSGFLLQINSSWAKQIKTNDRTARWLALLPHSKKHSAGFETWLGVASSQSHKNVHKCGCVGVNVKVNGCLTMSALWWTGDLSRVYPNTRPVSTGIGSTPLVTVKDKRLWKMNEWSSRTLVVVSTSINNHRCWWKSIWHESLLLTSLSQKKHQHPYKTRFWVILSELLDFSRFQHCWKHLG